MKNNCEPTLGHRSVRRFIRSLWALLFTLVLTSVPFLSQAEGLHDPQNEATKSVLVRGGWLFDGVSQKRRRNSGILIRGNKIAAVDLDGQTLGTEQLTLVQLDDSQTMLPGLIDLHAHYNLDLVDEGRVEEVVHNGMLFLANGVTSTWSAGEYFPQHVLTQRDLIENGKAIGPRLFNSGPYFGAFRCEYQVKMASDDCIAWPNDISEQEIRDEVDKWSRLGVISIKIKQATPEEAKILIEQAHKNGMTTAGHLGNYNVEYDVTTRDAILMGIDRIEHQLTLALSSEDPRSAETAEMVELMIKHQVHYGPNLQMYGGINLRSEHLAEMIWTNETRFFTPYTQGLLEKRGPPKPESAVPEYTQRVAELIALYEAGGDNLIVVGTDEPVYTNLLPGFAYHRELLAMRYAGLPALTVLKAATINGASALGIDDKLGSIEVGKLADMVVVNGNPLDDVKAARSVHLVVKDGVVHNPKELLQSAEGKIGPSGPSDHAAWRLEVKPLRSSKQK